MVKKLFKHEFIAIGRIVLPVAAILLITAFLSSLTLLVQSNTMEFLQELLLSLFVIAIVCISTLTFICCILRFQKSVFSTEGYLTLALPVTPMQILLVKAVVSIVAIIFSFLVTLLSIEIFGIVHGMEIIGTLVSGIIELLSLAGGVVTGIVIYLIILLLFAEISGLLFIYACISAGQLVNKHRTALSVGSYIIVNQLLSVVSLFIVSAITGMLPVETQGSVAFPYIILSVYLVQFLLLGIASIIFVRYILKNKVNLLT